MAEPMTIRLLDVLLAELQRITIANGFQTDLGLWIGTERSQETMPSRPHGTLAIVGKRSSSNSSTRPDPTMAVEGVIEVLLPASFGQAMDTVYRADADVVRALLEMGERLNSGAIPAFGALVPIYSETQFLNRPEGLPFCGAEILWTTAWREDSK